MYIQHSLPAETAVLDFLRDLQKIDSPYAAKVMDLVAKVFLNTSIDDVTARRRAHALLRIAGGQ